MSTEPPADQEIDPSGHDYPLVDIRRTTSKYPCQCNWALINSSGLPSFAFCQEVQERSRCNHGRNWSFWADYTSDFVCDFMCDLLQIAGAISYPHCGSYSGHQIASAICSKSHTKSLVLSAPSLASHICNPYTTQTA
jgi:hypothetical protein